MTSKVSRQELDEWVYDEDSLSPELDRILSVGENTLYDERSPRRDRRYEVRRRIEDYADTRRMRKMLGDLD